MADLRTILFDVDGVLIDSERIYQSCWLQAAKQEGYAMCPEQALQLRSLDSRLAEKLFLQWYGNPTAYSAVRAARKNIMNQYLQNHPLTLKSGVKETLSYLKQHNYCLAVVTASNLEKAKAYLHNVALDDYFTHIISTQLVLKGKPFPDVYLYACTQLKQEPQQCLAVEDSPNGVKAAHTAGCRTIMIPDLTPYTNEVAAYVDACYNDFAQFLQYEIIRSIGIGT